MSTPIHTARLFGRSARFFLSPWHPTPILDAPWVEHDAFVTMICVGFEILTGASPRGNIPVDETLIENRTQDPDHVGSILVGDELLAVISPEIAKMIVDSALQCGAPPGLAEAWRVEALHAYLNSIKAAGKPGAALLWHAGSAKEKTELDSFNLSPVTRDLLFDLGRMFSRMTGGVP